MKAIFTKVPEVIQDEIFAVRITDASCFSTEFHFHKECQMVYVVESEGKRIIGDSVETFKSDELIFLGSGIPHAWHNDKAYIHTGENHARSIALFFDPDKLIELLSAFVQVKKLESFLETAQLGMKFSGHTKALLSGLLLEMSSREGLAQLISLLKILENLSTTNEYELLASDGYINTCQATDNDRMGKVFKHIFSNFTTEIQLNEVASLANMNKQAFCRYFKSRTQKTFTEFVNNIRITHACKLMAADDCQIAALAYDCGFNSVSNFNRFFKAIKGITPREYKKEIWTGDSLPINRP